MIGGGILGHFHHKGLGLTDGDRERIAAEIAGGKAAIGILVEEDAEAAMISRKLTDLGGIAEIGEVTGEALDAVATAAPGAQAAPESAPFVRETLRPVI